MSIKTEVLKLLSIADGEYISGEELGKKLFCSRNAVWKAIKSLQNEGYEIHAVTNKGYALVGGDVFSIDGIHKYLTAPAKIRLYGNVTSTNDVLKSEAQQNASEGLVVVADEQTNGKGRLGRSFYSPASTGMYMSILLRPEITAQESLMITTAAAVAVCRAIEKICDKKCGIKWVNDIFIDGLKVCGILTEAAVDFETGALQYAVVGLGVNLVLHDDMPEELRNIVGAVYRSMPKNCDIKNRLCAEIINNFFDYYIHIQTRSFMEDYRQRSIVIGKKINVIQNGRSRKATALEIDDDAQLSVIYDNGEKATVSTGEVSVRLEQ